MTRPDPDPDPTAPAARPGRHRGAGGPTAHYGHARGADGLTARQRECLDTIRRLQAEQGYFPTIRQLSEALGCASPNAAYCVLQPLAKLGHLRTAPRAGSGGRRYMLPEPSGVAGRWGIDLRLMTDDDLARLRDAAIAELERRDVCEHGVRAPDYCEPCRLEYRRAREEAYPDDDR